MFNEQIKTMEEKMGPIIEMEFNEEKFLAATIVDKDNTKKIVVERIGFDEEFEKFFEVASKDGDLMTFIIPAKGMHNVAIASPNQIALIHDIINKFDKYFNQVNNSN